MPPEQRGPGQWRARSAQKPALSGWRSSRQASVPSYGANPRDADARGPSLKLSSVVGRLHGESHVPNRTGEIPPSGMTRGDTGNGPRRGMRHRRVPIRSRSQLLPAADWHCACVLSQPGCGSPARPDPWRGLRATVISTPTHSLVWGASPSAAWSIRGNAHRALGSTGSSTGTSRHQPVPSGRSTRGFPWPHQLGCASTRNGSHAGSRQRCRPWSRKSGVSRPHTAQGEVGQGRPASSSQMGGVIDGEPGPDALGSRGSPR
jgi:hypothetical protein